MLLGALAQVIENHAGLHAGAAVDRVEVKDPVQVLGKIHPYSHVAALTGERSAAAAGKQWRAMLATKGDGGDDIVQSLGKHHADGYLTVVAAVGGVESAAAGIEAHLALNLLAQVRGQVFG